MSHASLDDQSTLKVEACPCPVCAASADHFLTVDGRGYFRCPTCEARFLDPARRLSHDKEYAHYLHHENDPDDPLYRRFLGKLAEPLMARLEPHANGLDYGCGCGPGPALAHMPREAGHDVALYDPFFVPDAGPLGGTHDFVTCTEAVEHFHHPAAEFARLRGLVSPGGWLGIMTCFQTEDARFADWQYRKDLTHVVYCREETFRYLAADWGWSCEVPVKDVVLMRRPGVRA